MTEPSEKLSEADYIAQQVRAFPNRFQGVCAIPQAPGAPITLGFPEIDRRFIGADGSL